MLQLFKIFIESFEKKKSPQCRADEHGAISVKKKKKKNTLL
jgi:hypothetical protein